MTGRTITGHTTPTVRPALPERVTASRAARELGLRRGEFDLAVRLGRVRTVTDPACGPEPPGTAEARRRVTRVEIDRLNAERDFPESLRADVRTVSASQGARDLGITTDRFTRLARLGLLTPVAFYVNRYRAVVWLYLAAELRVFAATESSRSLLTDRLPRTLRSQLDTGVDLRARNWRSRHAGFLLRLAEDAWTRAAATASLLEADEITDMVADPHERACLAWLTPERPDRSPPGSLAAQVADELLKADDPEEIAWLRASLSLGLADARRERPAARLVPWAAPPARYSGECPEADAADRTDRSAAGRGGANPGPDSAGPPVEAADDPGGDGPPAGPAGTPGSTGPPSGPAGEQPRGRARGVLGWFRRGER